MTPEEFRKAGHTLIDWIADYREQIPEQPVRAQVEPGEVRQSFSSTPPQTPDSFAHLLTELETKVVPGITQVQHPMHFGWFPSNASLSSVLGDIASSGLGTLGISWESCPALTEV
jgi:aromatic-L-amino-acid decarboxylase